MNETQMKSMAAAYIKRRYSADHSWILLDEFRYVRGQRRADLALISTTRTIAVEIKTESDSLSRIAGQSQQYSSRFDKVFYFLHYKFGRSIERLNFQENEEIVLFDNLKTKVIKRGRLIAPLSKSDLIDLLNDEDIRSLMKTHRKKRWDSFSDFLDSIPVVEIRKAIYRRAKKIAKKRPVKDYRSDQSSSAFPSSTSA